MTTANFEVKTYEVSVAREMGGVAGGLSVKFPAYIICRGDEYHAVIYALADTSPVPENTFIPSAKRGTIFVPRWQFEWFRDLVRNEKPIYCYLNSDTPKSNSISTSREPVGEGEL